MGIDQTQQQQMLLDPNQQLLLDPNQQHIFVDDQGRQVLLSPDQQLQLLQQFDDGQQLVQLSDGDQGGVSQLLQLDPGLTQQQLVQLEGENGEKMMVALPDTNQLLFQDDLNL